MSKGEWDSCCGKILAHVLAKKIVIARNVESEEIMIFLVVSSRCPLR